MGSSPIISNGLQAHAKFFFLKKGVVMPLDPCSILLQKNRWAIEKIKKGSEFGLVSKSTLFANREQFLQPYYFNFLLSKVFEDAYKSPLSIIILDDIER